MAGLRTGFGLSTDPDPVAATASACATAFSALEGESADLAVAFITPDRAAESLEIAQTIHAELAPGALLGCTAQGVIGGSREVERPPAISVWAARLPQTEVHTFQLTAMEGPDDWAFSGWPPSVATDAIALMLADPFTFPVDALLARLNDQHPNLRVIGGMASGAMRPGETRLFVDKEVTNGGAAGALISGRVKVRALVSQGCRPVGSPAVVTKADRNIIVELGGKSPFERLQETFAASSPEERTLMQRGIHVGLVIDEYKDVFRAGDFVIRSVLGADRETGAIAVGDVVDVGNTVQFHVRDAASADAELRTMVSSAGITPGGALLFTCNGRGTNLFPEPDHDARLIQEGFGGIPLAGFFCAGELGPVGGRNYVHGFTASMALFYEEG